MLDEKGNIKNLLNGLQILESDYEKGVVDIRKNDIVIVKEVNSLIKNAIHVLMPMFPEDFDSYNKKKKIERDDLGLSYLFEYNLVDYDSIFFSDKEKENEVDNPHFLCFIKNKNGNLNKIESAIGKRIRGDLLFVIRKKEGFWELPNRSFVLDNEYDCIDELDLFPNLYFQLSIEKDLNILSESEKGFRKFTTELLTKFSTIVFNNDEELFSKNGETFYPSSFLEEKRVLTLSEQNNRIKEVKESMFDINLLYSNIIRFGGE